MVLGVREACAQGAPARADQHPQQGPHHGHRHDSGGAKSNRNRRAENLLLVAATELTTDADMTALATALAEEV